MRKLTQRLPLAGIIVSTLVLALVVPASAHVVVQPKEALTASFQTFTVGVPNEKSVPTTAVKVDIPTGLQFVSPTQKPGWQITVEKTGEGEGASAKSITWSGNQVAAGFRDDFTFSAKLPEDPTELQWKAYQTYADGQVVAWELSEADQPKKADGAPDFSKSGPLSVTNVVSTTDQAAAIEQNRQANEEAKKAVDSARTIAYIALALSVAAVAVATRKPRPNTTSAKTKKK